MMDKYYFKHSYSEICYTMPYFNELMKAAGIKEIEVYEAIKDKIKGVYWCRKHKFCGEDSTVTCGKVCEEYSPRNKVSGCCRFYSTGIYDHGDKVTLELQK